MELKYFAEAKTENGYGDIGLVLEENIFSIAKEDGMFIIREECDGYYCKTFTKEQTIELLQEAIKWVGEH